MGQSSAGLSPRRRSTGGVFLQNRPPSLGLDLAEALEDEVVGARWPNAKYADDPVGFVEEVLHDHPTKRQVEFLEAVRDNQHVAFKSSHKVGKSRALVWVALWWFCTRIDARVLLTSSVERQVDKVLWREMILVIRKSGIQLDARPAEHAKTGMVAHDMREIVGLSAREAESVAGTSGINVLYLVDEASGCAETLFAAFEGNLAGGGKLVLCSNPTRCNGQFFDAFQPASLIENGGPWKTLSANALESPNVIAGRMVIPGLATLEYVEGRKAAWGEDSAEYKVRVLGEFPTNEERRMLTIHDIKSAEDRWEDASDDGPLRIGLDVAGAGVGGDESVLALRRGKKLLALYAYRSAREADLLAFIRGFIREHRRTGEGPVHVVVDCEGFGWPVYEHIAGHAMSEDGRKEMLVFGVHAGHRAQRDPTRFDRTRDELFAAAEAWIKDGGAIPRDVKLSQELHAPEWNGTASGRLKATDKDTLKKILGRSPDRLDAVCLSCWEVDNFAERVAEQKAAVERENLAADQRRVPRFDPWAAEKAWRR
jgi:phage terminase large subunit